MKSATSTIGLRLAMPMLAVVLVIDGGLGGSLAARSPSYSSAEGSATPSATPAASPAASPPPVGASGEYVVITTGKVTLEINEQSVSPRHFEVAAGHDLHLTITNRGESRHRFTIDKLNVSADLQPGETRTLTIEKPPLGEYDYYVDDGSGGDSNLTGTFTIYI